MDQDRLWQGVAGAAGLGAVRVSKPLVERTWKAFTGSEPPGNPASAEVSWREAMLWALVTGAVLGVLRLVAQRLAAGAWRGVTGDYPDALAVTRP